jgi:Protein of unknown function (DUF3096)
MDMPPIAAAVLHHLRPACTDDGQCATRGIAHLDRRGIDAAQSLAAEKSAENAARSPMPSRSLQLATPDSVPLEYPPLREASPMTVDVVALQPLVALIAGILILLVPRLLNYVVAIYLILIGLIGLWPHLLNHTLH